MPPIELDGKFEDGWGQSNGPPIAARTTALMKSANRRLSPREGSPWASTIIFEGFDKLTWPRGWA